MPAEPKIVTLPRSEYAEKLIMWEGKPLKLDMYPMFKATYDGDYKMTVLKTSRQVGKSIRLMVYLLTDSITREFFKSLFVTPTEAQTDKFSNLRVTKAIKFSPRIRDNYVDPSMPNSVRTRSFSNGSEIVFTFASDNADRVRGNSADHIMIDETQDVLLDAVIPEIREVLSESTKGKYQSFCGTPKTMENGLEHLWKNSSQTEWAMKCTGCGKYSIIVSEKQLGKLGPICGNCSTYLNPRTGIWVDTNRDQAALFKGFHISRPIMLRGVAACWTPGSREHEKALIEWKDDILGKMEGAMAYPVSKFRNEVLGMSDSVGTRLVTEEMLWAAADGPVMSPKPTPELMQGIVRVSAGIDWSGGGADGHSTTVLVVLGRMATGKVRVLYFKVFSGMHAAQENEEIRSVLRNYDINQTLLVGGDAGEGNMNMDMLRTSMANPARVVKFRYVGPNAKHYCMWDKARNTYMVNRTNAIDSVMSAFLRKDVQFPREPRPYLQVAFKHILSEHEEVTSKDAGGRKVWRHAPTDPDDFLHALVFARLAVQIATGEINLGSSLPEGDA